jgi:hypothetical protein
MTPLFVKTLILSPYWLEYALCAAENGGLQHYYSGRSRSRADSSLGTGVVKGKPI